MKQVGVLRPKLEIVAENGGKDLLCHFCLKVVVYELLSASTASAVLGTAIESGLLWLLAEKPLDGENVAQALNIPSKRCHLVVKGVSGLNFGASGSLNGGQRSACAPLTA